MRLAATALLAVTLAVACDHPNPPTAAKPGRDATAARPVTQPQRRAPPDVSRLDRSTTIQTARSVSLRATGTTLLLGGDSLRSYPLGAATPSAILTGADASVSQFLGTFFAVKGLALGLSTTAEVTALDAATGDARWRWRNADPSPSTLDSVTSVGDALAMVFARPAATRDGALRGQLVVVSAARGEPRWTHDFEQVPVGVTSDGARLFVLEMTGRLTALNGSDGAETWHADGDSPATRDDVMLFDGGALAITSPDRPMRILRARDGSLDHAVELPGQAYARHPAAAGGGLVVVPVSTLAARGHERSLGAVRFVAVELSSGRVRWQTDELRGADRPSLSPPVIERDAVFTCGGDGVLRAHDLATGQERWQSGVGGCNTVTPIADRDSGALAIAVAWREDSVAIFRRGERAPAALERATVTGVVTARGRPVAGCTVLVGDQSLRTDARGRYAATVTARGVVRVALPLEEFAAERLVELNGSATPYEASFALPKHERD